MTLLKSTIAAVTLCAFAATTAVAGGFAPAVEGVAVEIVEPTAAPAGSLPGWVIPVVIAAVLIAIATTGGSDAEADPA